jgi:6-phosphogluconolactonase (cycloisomerase 2 family)
MAISPLAKQGEDMSKSKGKATSMIVITPIIPGKLDSIKRVLKGIDEKQPSESPIARINTIHYATWAIINDDKDLLFNTNFDGTWEDYLDAFVKDAADGLNAIWSNCVGYPGAQPKDKFFAYVQAHEVNAAVFHAAYPNTTVKQVEKALGIQKKFEEFLDEFN